MNGQDYKRGSLLCIIRGCLRAVNAHNDELQLAGSTSPPAHIRLEDQDALLLKHNLDAVCQQLTSEGKGDVDQQPPFSHVEWSTLTQHAETMYASSWKHLVRGYLTFGTSWGGRIEEYPKIMRK